MVKNVLWDFDGVILDSMHIRDYGFVKIFQNYPKSDVDKLLAFHRKNGGWSRYVKIRYFFEEILHKTISESEVRVLADKFSEIMKEELIKPEHMIRETVDFIESNHNEYNFHVVSGSDENELRYLCARLGISNYFKSIHGSPTPKNDLVQIVLKENNYNNLETILIGDSKNDFEAARINSIGFYGYNNKALNELSDFYIYSFKHLTL